MTERKAPKTAANGRPTAKSGRKPTLRQTRFVNHFTDPNSPGFGNGSKAAELAGYSGAPGSNQLAVRASETLRNPNVQRTIADVLDAMVGHGLERLAEAIDATKTQSFITKEGVVVSSQPEADHNTRLRAVALLFRVRGQVTIPNPPADQHAGDAHQQNQSSDESRKEVTSMDPADRMLLRKAGDLEKQLVEVERQLGEDEDGSSGQGRS